MRTAREMDRESEKALQACFADMQKIIDVKDSQIINQAKAHSEDRSRIASLQASLATKDASIQQQDQAGQEEIKTQKAQLADLKTTNSDYATRIANWETSNKTQDAHILEFKKALEDRKAISLREEEGYKRLQAEIERMQIDTNAKIGHLESINNVHVSNTPQNCGHCLPKRMLSFRSSNKPVTRPRRSL